MAPVVWVVNVDDGSNPLDGVLVEYSTDTAKANVVQSGYTASGAVTFSLNAGTYYSWCHLDGYNFTLPTTVVITIAGSVTVHGTATTGIVNGYATLAELKAWYKTRGGDDKADTGDDVVINSIIEAVSRYIDNEVGRRFWTTSADETRYFTVEPTYTHSSQAEEVEVGDLLSATTVAVDYDEDRNYTALTVTTDYEFEPVNAALDGWPYSSLVLAPQTDEYFPTTRRGVQVVGKWGFPAIPTDIKNLCLAMTLNIYSERSGQTSPGNITITAAGVVIRPQDVPAWGKRVLLKYSAI
jgi:hypothetical protein